MHSRNKVSLSLRKCFDSGMKRIFFIRLNYGPEEHWKAICLPCRMRHTFFCRDWARGSGGSGKVGHQEEEHKKLQLTKTMDPFGFFGDSQPWSIFSGPGMNFAGSIPSVSTPAASATCPSAALSTRTSLGSDFAANSNPYFQIPDEYSPLGDESFWYELPWLEDPVEGPHLLPEPHTVHEVENGGFWNVFNVETNVVPPAVSRSSTSSRWQNFVWLIRACHRFSHAAAASLRAKVPEAHINYTIKGVMEKKGKFVCETRVMRKIQLEKKRSIKKVWLGTYETPAEAARALDVGKYFFNAKKTKTYFDPNTETMLSTLSPQLLAQPLDVLVEKVKQIANYYGIHGKLP